MGWKMPVFVEWKWIESTKSFLVVFHFYDDFSKPNLRIKKCEKGTPGTPSMFTTFAPDAPSPSDIIQARKAWMTWAPSHSELALLMELLSYANIINGLKETEKRKLKFELQGRKALILHGVPEDEINAAVSPVDAWVQVGVGKKAVTYFEPEVGPEVLHFCIELCSEYIDYLRFLLELYLK